jgi:hypothetical protein
MAPVDPLIGLSICACGSSPAAQHEPESRYGRFVFVLVRNDLADVLKTTLPQHLRRNGCFPFCCNMLLDSPRSLKVYTQRAWVLRRLPRGASLLQLW